MLGGGKKKKPQHSKGRKKLGKIHSGGNTMEKRPGREALKEDAA